MYNHPEASKSPDFGLEEKEINSVMSIYVPSKVTHNTTTGKISVRNLRYYTYE